MLDVKIVLVLVEEAKGMVCLHSSVGVGISVGSAV